MPELVETPFACSCPACRAGLTPFTVEHFRVWARELVLDNGQPWILGAFQEAFADDLFGFTRAGIPAECWLIVPEGNGKTTLVAGQVCCSSRRGLRAYCGRGSQLVARQVMRPQARWSIAR